MGLLRAYHRETQMRQALIFLIPLFAGCGGEVSQFAAVGAEVAPAAKAAQPGEVARQVVVTAALDLTVTDLQAASGEVERLTQSVSGYVAKSESNVAPGGYRSTSWTLRIPAARFTGALGDLAKLGTPTRTATEAEDVTAEFIDLEARLSNFKKQEDALNRLLTTTESEETVLKIQDSVRKVRTELDSAEGRRKYLAQAVEYARLTVTARESTRYTPPDAEVAPGFGERARRTLAASARGLVEFGVDLALVCVAIVPWLPLIAVMTLIFRWGARRLLRLAGRQVAWLLSPAKPPPDPFASPFPEVKS